MHADNLGHLSGATALRAGDHDQLWRLDVPPRGRLGNIEPGARTPMAWRGGDQDEERQYRHCEKCAANKAPAAYFGRPSARSSARSSIVAVAVSRTTRRGAFEPTQHLLRL